MMILYYKSNTATAKLHVDNRSNPAQIDALMARDGFVRCSRAEWLAAKHSQNAKTEVSK